MWRRSSHCDSATCVEVAFRTSSRSAGNGNCVEVGFHSASIDNGTCVEVGTCTCGEVLVRDSKDRDGPVLSFGGAEWSAFVAGVHAGEFDLRRST